MRNGRNEDPLPVRAKSTNETSLFEGYLGQLDHISKSIIILNLDRPKLSRRNYIGAMDQSIPHFIRAWTENHYHSPQRRKSCFLKLKTSKRAPPRLAFTTKPSTRRPRSIAGTPIEPEPTKENHSKLNSESAESPTPPRSTPIQTTLKRPRPFKVWASQWCTIHLAEVLNTPASTSLTTLFSSSERDWFATLSDRDIELLDSELTSKRNQIQQLNRPQQPQSQTQPQPRESHINQRPLDLRQQIISRKPTHSQPQHQTNSFQPQSEENLSVEASKGRSNGCRFCSHPGEMETLRLRDGMWRWI